MSDDKETEPVASINLNSFTTVEDVRFLINQLHNHTPYTLQYVNDPEDTEADIYLLAEIED